MATLTPEQIAQFLASQQQVARPPAAAPTAVPGLEGFDDAELFGRHRKMHEYPGHYVGVVQSLQITQTSPASPKGVRPLLVLEVQVERSSSPDVPPGSCLSHAKTGGPAGSIPQKYYQSGLKELLSALTGKPAEQVKMPDVVAAASAEQPHTGRRVAWETYSYVNKAGKPSLITRFSFVSDPA
jgi:hypothetical protein